VVRAPWSTVQEGPGGGQWRPEATEVTQRQTSTPPRGAGGGGGGADGGRQQLLAQERLAEHPAERLPRPPRARGEAPRRLAGACVRSRGDSIGGRSAQSYRPWERICFDHQLPRFRKELWRGEDGAYEADRVVCPGLRVQGALGPVGRCGPGWRWRRRTSSGASASACRARAHSRPNAAVGSPAPRQARSEAAAAS
jgi:hypothetical protein